ncbi:hypothetical protein C8R43DRAFT_953518 [Mycena crocata]|nr:hypothetical protein C8R43DRAFT_953518 [Mycena crocata]
MNTSITFHDLVSYSLGVTPEGMPRDTKRNGVYFKGTEHTPVSATRPLAPETTESEQIELIDAQQFHSDHFAVLNDDISTWEFNAPVALSHSWHSDASTLTSPYQTAAQDVAFRYRAGLKVEIEELSCALESCEDKKHYASSFDDAASYSYVEYVGADSDSTSSSSSSAMSLPVPISHDLKPTFRESRANALMDIHDEALAMVKADGLGENQPVVCHRPSCRDTLPTMKALMYHLHIHNLADRFKCDACSRGFETRRDLTMHACPRLATSLPCSPIRGTFMRVLTKITSRE